MNKLKLLLVLLAVKTHQIQAQVVWSETFANGIPSGWTNSGTANGTVDPDAIWSYRGPSTTPSNATGSRGAYAGPASTGQLPIQSPTAANGFVIFDSDYLDNNGVAGNFCGTGALACAPHVANLTTSTINLSGYSNIELEFYQYYRRFAGPGGVQTLPATYIDFSTNGGLTWTGSIPFNSSVAVNAATQRNSVIQVNITQFAANQSNVKLRFRFEGDYYFWQIDDIKITSIPRFRMTPEPLTPVKVDANSSSFTFSGSNYSDGRVTLRQCSPITFKGSFRNTGTQPITNSKLSVRIFKNGIIDTIVSSSNIPTVATNIAQTFTLTNGYLPSDTGVYAFQFIAQSDSVAQILDSLWLTVTRNQIGSDFGVVSNTIGSGTNTTQWGTGSGVRQVFNLSNDTLIGLKVGIGSATLPASLVISINQSNSTTYNLSQTDITNGFAYIPFSTEIPVSNSTEVQIMLNGTIMLKNDATVSMESGRRMMYLAAISSWLTGYSNSDVFNRIHLSLLTKGIYVPPIATTTDTLTICAGDTVHLNGASGYSSYLWSNGVTSQNLAVTTSGSYYLTVTNAAGTSSISDTFNIQVLSKPILTTTIFGALSFCNGDSVTISASGCSSYIWNDGSTLSSRVFQNSGAVTLIGYDAQNYCASNPANFTLTEFSLPNVSVTVNGPSSLCPQETTVLSASGALSYTWNTGDTISNLVVTTPGAYYVTGIDSNGCANSDTVIIGSNPAVSITQIFGPNQVLPNASTTYATNQVTGNTYNWTVNGGAIISGQGTNSVNVMWGNGASGFIKVTESNGFCTNADSVSIQISGLINEEQTVPKAMATPSPTSGILTLVWQNLNATRVVIYNVVGQVVATKNIQEGAQQAQVDLSTEASGVYRAVIYGKEGQVTLPLVLRH